MNESWRGTRAEQNPRLGRADEPGQDEGADARPDMLYGEPGPCSGGVPPVWSSCSMQSGAKAPATLAARLVHPYLTGLRQPLVALCLHV